MKAQLISFAFFALATTGVACRREPTIVIRFEPVDMAGRDAAKAAVAVAQAVRVVADAGSGSGSGSECMVSTECMLVPEDCCDCAHGGAMRAVSKSAYAKISATVKAKCKEMMCTAMVSNDPSCAAKAACVSGRCVTSK